MSPGAARGAGVRTPLHMADLGAGHTLLLTELPPCSRLSLLGFLLLQLDTGKTFQAVMRFDTDVELTYFHNGGILNYMIRKMAK